MLKKFEIKTNQRNQMIDITSEISKFIELSKIESGICVVYSPHTTAGITINENSDADVCFDMISFFNKLIPKSNLFNHSEGNSDSHIKTSLFSCNQTIIIQNGELLLGTWQGIYFCEFDGPRFRNYFVKIIKG